MSQSVGACDITWEKLMRCTVVEDKTNKVSTLLSETAATILGPSNQCDRYLGFLRSGHKSTRNDRLASKQSLYESVVRAEHSVLAGLPYFLATHCSPEHIDTFFSHGVGLRGLLSDAVIKKGDWLAQSRFNHSTAEWDALKPKFEQLWEAVVQRMVDQHLRGGLSCQSATMHLYLYTFFFIARLYKNNFSTTWADTWRLAKRKGMLDNLHTNRQLATIGAYTGEADAQMEYLVDKGNQTMEVAQILLFVSGGTRSSLPSEALIAGNPEILYSHIKRNRQYGEKSIKSLLSYCATCLHHRIYNHESLILMVFTWLQWVCRESIRLNITHKLGPDLLKIRNLLDLNKRRLQIGVHSKKAYLESVNLLSAIVSNLEARSLI